MSPERPSISLQAVRRRMVLAMGGLLALGLLACSVSEESDVSPFQGTAIGISTEDIDTATDPGNDFYRYANGNWLANTQIPADADYIARRSRAEAELERRLTTIVEDIAGRPQDGGTAEAVVRDYYRLFMDRDAINAQGVAPMLGDIRRFQSITDAEALSRVIGGTLRADANLIQNPDSDSENLFAVAAMAAPDDGEVIAWLFQGGLGMPGVDRYLEQSSAARADRAAYRDLVARTLSLAGLENATARADAVLELEAKIAAAHDPAMRGRELFENAAVWSRDELAANAPGLDWQALLKAAGLDGADRFAMVHPDAIAELSALTASEPLDAWRDWLVFHRLNSHAAVLPTDFGRAHFAFYGQRLAGRNRSKPLEQQVVSQIGSLFSETMSRLYAERYFSAEEKRDVEIIAQRVRDALIARIEADADLGEGARSAAIAKLEALKPGIGYPETYDEITRLRAVGNNAYAKTIAAERAVYAREIAAIGKPVDQGRWWTGTHRIGVISLPLQNGINVPAAILQPPFYDPEADAAANYGGIGTIVGHEMSHAVDPAGAMVDSTGRVNDWLAAQDRQLLDRRGRIMARQYGEYLPLAGNAIDGERTLAENYADLAGLVAAHDAYRASLDGREPRVIEGFTGDQRFFIAFAQLWAFKIRDAYTRRLMDGSSFALPQYRVATVRNIDAWYRAFDVQDNDALYLPPAERARVW